jgi:hypothetical protein
MPTCFDVYHIIGQSDWNIRKQQKQASLCTHRSMESSLFSLCVISESLIRYKITEK